MALKEEKVLVLVERKRPVFERRPIAVSATIPKIVSKNQSTLPPHLPSQLFHEAAVCRGRELSEAKVTMVPFFDNRAVVI